MFYSFMPLPATSLNLNVKKLLLLVSLLFNRHNLLSFTGLIWYWYGYKRNNMSKAKKLKEHHKQLELCKTRPAYRQGRNLTAVKAYTVNSESQHLFIYGVPSINLRNELKKLCGRYGEVVSIHVVPDVPTELFTECYHVQYRRIQSSRIAKKLLDTKSFYGGILHVCYAPECESIEETKAKLLQRKRDVLNRLPKQLNRENT